MTKRFNSLRLKDTSESKKGIVYLGHLPKGLGEDELKKYFTQFGKVAKIRLSRSKKTARSKGYAFIQFDDHETAQVAAETMDNYMIFGRSLKAQVVTPEMAHKDMFKNGNRKWKFIPTQQLWREKKNNLEMTDEQRKARVEGLLKKENEKRDRLKELGIEYEYPGYSALVAK